MAENTAPSATDEKFSGEEDYVAAWGEAIGDASDEEKDWREGTAKEASDTYAGAKDSKLGSFNIVHSNIETVVPALYNSTPSPDVRRRYGEDDKVGKAVADLLERALSYAVDAYDFDDVMLSCVKDMATVDRGIARVRYEPYFGDEPLA